MQRKLTVLWQTVAVVLIASSLLFGYSWHYTNAKPYISKWFYSSDWNPANETGTEAVTTPMEEIPPPAPSSPPSNPIPKETNATLLEMAPTYIKAIMTPEDTSFPRLACPAPTGDRYSYLKAGSANRTHRPTIRPEYFFALDLHQCASVLPRLIGSVLESIRFLGPQNCALSVVEGRSDDGTFEILLLLREEVERLGAKYYFNSSDINPELGGVDDRIKALAELRNQALQPLLDHADNVNSTNSTTVIFLNDVAICMEDILELIHQRKYQNADVTCAMDWTYVGPDPTFYDVWIARGMNGDTFFNIPEDGNWNSAWNIFWNNPIASERQRMGKPFQVFSCWNGATAFTAEPFLQSRIRFRMWHEHECPQGEPKTWCTEMWHLGYRKIAVVPSVNLEYSDEAAKKIKAAKGYVSRFVGRADEGEERIKWDPTPPSTVKCMPSYQNQTWVPWEEYLVEYESTHREVLRFRRGR